MYKYQNELNIYVLFITSTCPPSYPPQHIRFFIEYIYKIYAHIYNINNS